MRVILLVVLAFTFLNPAFAYAQIKQIEDSEGYGDIFDNLNNKKSSISNTQKFNGIKPYLNTSGISSCLLERAGRNTSQSAITCKSICQPLSELISEDYYPAVSFALNDSLKSMGSSVVSTCNFMPYGIIDGSHLANSASRIPQVKNNKYDTYNLALFAQNGKRQNEARAFLLMSANLGYDKAEFEHGKILLKTGSEKEAFIYLNKAAAQGNIQAIQTLKQEFDYDVKPNAILSSQAASDPITTGSNVPSNVSQSIPSVPSVMAKDYWVKSSSANIYDNTGNVIGKLGFAAPVTTYGEKDGKGKIDLSSENWINLSELSNILPAQAELLKETVSAPKQVDNLNLTKYTTADPLNYRDAPNGNKLGSLSYGSLVKVYEERDNWVRISKSNETPNWVHKDYVSKSKPRPKKTVTRTQSKRGFKEIGDGGRYGISRSLKTLKSKCSYRQMAQFSVGEYVSGGCHYVVQILKKEPNHPYSTNLTRYMNSSLWP